MIDRPPDGVSSEQFVDLLSAGMQQPMALPSWLLPVLITLYDGCGGGAGSDSGSDAAGWLRRIRNALQASGGTVPFAVVHDWQARTVVPMMSAAAEATAGFEPAESSKESSRESSKGAEAMSALQGLHARAAAGESAEAPVWLAALEPALHELYRLAYDYAGSYASAHASASAYATANNFSADGAVSFAESYAAHSAEANRQSFADSNAPAIAAALAAAYARPQGDTDANHAEAADAGAGSADAGTSYAEAYSFAMVHACAHAVAAAHLPAEHAADPDRVRQHRRSAYLRLANGLADSLARLS